MDGIIDSHQHFWKYNVREFGWIATDSLRRDFGPEDLKRELSRVDREIAAGGVRTIAVEARQSLEETRQLLAYAEKYDFIAGVTGWVDLLSGVPLEDQLTSISHNAIDESTNRRIDEFSDSNTRIDESTNRRIDEFSRLIAIRHVVQDEPDDAFILREDFNRGVDLVGKAGKAYEILVFQRQLANAIKFADRHPDMRLVLDHMGKPESVHSAECRVQSAGSGKPNDEWVRLIREMAKRENVWCKVSGLVTEVGKVDFAPYVETVLEAFGPKRVMWGSDWPVVTADLCYAEWFAAAQRFLPQECLGRTAAEFYGLK